MRVKIKLMRRIQAAALVVALLAVPAALVARAYAGLLDCTMMCCRGHQSMKMNCGHAARGAAQCAMCSDSKPTPDYGLASPLAPFELQESTKLSARSVTRENFVAAKVLEFEGYVSPPFNPPRA